MSQRLTGSDVAQGLLRLSPSDQSDGPEASYYPLGSQKLFRATAGALFSLLLIVVFYFSGYLRLDPTGDPSTTQFSDAAVVRGPGSFLQVPHAPILNPAEDDLLLLSWVRPRALPPEGERQIFLLKYDGDKRSRTGYGLALSRRGEEVRPEVYWRDGEGKGGWYQYTPISVHAEEWVLLALSFRKGKLLGLHGAVLEESIGNPDQVVEVRLLGGYDVGEIGVPAPVADLFIGAPAESTFRGRVGMVGLFRGKELTENLKRLLDEVVRTPGTIDLSHFPKMETALSISDGKRDQSPHGHTVNLIRIKSQ